MKKVFALCIGVLLFASCSQDTIVPEIEEINVDQTTFARQGAKIDVCHKGKIINVSVNALNGHQGHGDAVDMDGDGYFDAENPCSDIDCDDTDSAKTDYCGPQIGDIIEGGVVFYIAPVSTDLDGDGFPDIGLVCALADITDILIWGCNDDLPNVPNVLYGDIPFASGLGAEIGDGMSNTNNILIDCPDAPAALAARTLGPDWFLPSIRELEQVQLNKATIESVSGVQLGLFHWSSTEGNPTAADFEDKGTVWNFGVSSIGMSYKDFSYTSDFPFAVRAVRAF